MDAWLPSSQAAEYLGVSVSTLYRMESKRLIESIRTPGGQRRFSVEELERYKHAIKRIQAPQNPSLYKVGTERPKSLREEQLQIGLPWFHPTRTNISACTSNVTSPAIREWIEEWDFRGGKTKTATHCFHPYPAMFIPQIARKLINAFTQPGDTVADIFCGSGTSLVEARLLNRPAVGIELNPLAVMIARVKTTPIEPDKLHSALQQVVKQFMEQPRVPISFPKSSNMDYWFSEDKREEINAVKTAIERLDEPELIHFFYVALSEIIRFASFTKNGEFKLVRDKRKVENGVRFDVIERFAEVARRNIAGMYEFYEEASTAETRLIHGDSTSEADIEEGSVALILTSPPYGDSRTTVAYGQFSRLSAQWLGLIPHDHKDIDANLLGGRPSLSLGDPVLERSATLRQSVKLVALEDEKRARDVVSFYCDLERTFVHAARYLRSGGYFTLVVGNRTVKGIQLKTDAIIAELVEHLGFASHCVLFRSIPNKRMPMENSPTNVVGAKAKTMHRESIVVLEKKT